MNEPDETPWARAASRRDRQLEVRRTHRIVPLGTGPAAPKGGWSVGPREWVRCTVCGYLLHLDGRTTDRCWCDAMSSDADAGRIGSALGDDAIERVRLEER